MKITISRGSGQTTMIEIDVTEAINEIVSSLSDPELLKKLRTAIEAADR